MGTDEFIFHSSHGVLVSDEYGNLRHDMCEYNAEDPDCWLKDVAKLDIPELLNYLKSNKLDEEQSEFDILEVGTFFKDGSYDGADGEWRLQIYADRIKENKRKLLTKFLEE